MNFVTLGLVTFAIALGGCAAAGNAPRRCATGPLCVVLEPGQRASIRVDRKTGSECELLVFVPEHELAGHPSVTSQPSGRTLWVREMRQYQDWGATYLLSEDARRELAPFGEPTKRVYCYSVRSDDHAFVVDWEPDSVDARSVEPGRIPRGSCP